MTPYGTKNIHTLEHARTWLQPGTLTHQKTTESTGTRSQKISEILVPPRVESSKVESTRGFFYKIRKLSQGLLTKTFQMQILLNAAGCLYQGR